MLSMTDARSFIFEAKLPFEMMLPKIKSLTVGRKAKYFRQIFSCAFMISWLKKT